MLSPPTVESLQRFLPIDEQWVGSPSWNFHNNLFEKDNLATCLRLYWQAPLDPKEPRGPKVLSLDEYVLATQIIQAEALKSSLEHFRHRKFATSGALFWMYSDAWGAIGWSIVDYYLNRKPAYYYVRRALAPLIVSFHEEVGTVREPPDQRNTLALWLTNDTLRTTECVVEYGVMDIIGSTHQVQRVEVISLPNSAQRVTEISFPDGIHAYPLNKDKEGRFVPTARVLVDGQTVSRNRWFPTGFNFRDNHLPQAEIHHALEQTSDREFRLHMESSTFAWAVALHAPPGVWVEDNYFDLLPGEAREIGLRGSEMDVTKLKVTPTHVSASERFTNRSTGA